MTPKSSNPLGRLGRALKRIAGGAAGLVAGLAIGGTAVAAPPIWSVSDADSTIYLFGTMHLLSDKADWQTPVLKKAMAEASDVWFETEIAPDENAAMLLFSRYGLDPANPLSKRLKPEVLTKVKAAFAAEDLPFERADIMRPWAAAMMISVMPAMKSGFSNEGGADATLDREAKAQGKTIKAFNSMEEQIRFLADLPAEVENQFLEDILSEADTDEDQSEAMQQAWLDGDVNALGPMILKEMKEQRPQLYSVLITGRNNQWVDMLTERMKGKGVTMVNVGALHMVGDEGLPALLAARGFRVERVQ